MTTLIYSLLVAALLYHVEVAMSYLMSLKLFSCPEPFIKWKICTYETPLFSPSCLHPTPSFSFPPLFLISEDASNIFFTKYLYQGKEKQKSLLH